MEHLAEYPGKRNWLKFGAADEKGQVLEDAWAGQARRKKAGCGSYPNELLRGYNTVEGHAKMKFTEPTSNPNNATSKNK